MSNKSPLFCVIWEYAYWDYPLVHKQYFDDYDEAFDFACELSDSGECLYVNFDEV